MTSHLELGFEARHAGHRRLLGADDEALLDLTLLDTPQPKLQVLAPLGRSHLHIIPVDGVDGDRHPAPQDCLTQNLGAGLHSARKAGLMSFAGWPWSGFRIRGLTSSGKLTRLHQDR